MNKKFNGNVHRKEQMKIFMEKNKFMPIPNENGGHEIPIFFLYLYISCSKMNKERMA